MVVEQALRLGVRLHGVDLTLESSHEELLAYAVRHLAGITTDPARTPELHVRAFWSEGDGASDSRLLAARHSLEAIGKRMLMGPDELVWLDTVKMKGLQLRFQKDGDAYEFDVDYRFSPKKEKVDQNPNYGMKKHFSLMKYLVYFPFFWYFEWFRNWRVLHASAVDTPKGGIVIAGLAGAGKTTTCLALMQHAGARLVSENVTFTDGTTVFACPEPVRADSATVDLVGGAPRGLVPIALPAGVNEKEFFSLSADVTAMESEPRALLLPRFSGRRYLHELDTETAAVRLTAGNRLTRELDDYEWYVAALAMLWPELEAQRQRGRAVSRLVENVKAFELGIDRTAGLDAVVEDALAACD